MDTLTNADGPRTATFTSNLDATSLFTRCSCAGWAAEIIARRPGLDPETVSFAFWIAEVDPHARGDEPARAKLMNLMMAAGGFPRVVIPVEQRHANMASLEKASVEGDIVPFARFLATMTAGQ